MLIWLAGQPCVPFYSLTASHTEQVSSPSSREERIKSHKISMVIKSWGLPWFFSLQKSHKGHMDLTSSLHALQPAPPAWLWGAWRNQSFVSQWLHLKFPFNGWREKGKITKRFLSRTKKLKICGANKVLLPFSTKHRDQAGPAPKTTTSPQHLCWMQKRPVLPRCTQGSYLFIIE